MAVEEQHVSIADGSGYMAALHPVSRASIKLDADASISRAAPLAWVDAPLTPHAALGGFTVGGKGRQMSTYLERLKEWKDHLAGSLFMRSDLPNPLPTFYGGLTFVRGRTRLRSGYCWGAAPHNSFTFLW
ncbi:hypothetical protein GGH92_001567 [Coemansia sp. RSA 2673]|nr:hypothetical protein GGH92_001567 [Coemansia sp. RSA 2673]